MSKDGYNINEAPVGNVRPAIPPKAPPAPPSLSKDLPLLPSERQELLQKVKDANARYEQAYDAARRSFTAIINNDESLSLEQKENILNLVWK